MNEEFLKTLGSIVGTATPLVIASLGETITERAGVVNLSLDGSLALAAVLGFAAAWTAQDAGVLDVPMQIALGIAVAMLVGALIALLVGFSSIKLRRDQVAVGFVLTLLAAELARFLGADFTRIPGPQITRFNIPLLEHVPILGPVFFQQNLLVYFSYLLMFGIWFWLFRTSGGLTLRAIGNSPALCKAVEALGWHYLFRVPKTVKIKTDSGILHPYKQVQQGGRWRASGSVFIKRGKLPAHVRAIWERDCAEPWILVTNNPDLTGREYAMRNWQEQSFRDLKSGGWQLEMCRLRSVERMERFLAILALAQGMALALGSQAVITGKARRLIKTKDDKLRRPLSLFKEGIAYFNKYIIRHDKFPSLPNVPEQTPC